MNELLAAGAGGALALATGLATPPRLGPALLVDAVLEMLRPLPGLALLCAAGLWLAPPEARPALFATAAFLPVYLHAVHGIRRPDAQCLLPQGSPWQRQRALWRQAAPLLARGAAHALALSLLLCALAPIAGAIRG